MPKQVEDTRFIKFLECAKENPKLEYLVEHFNKIQMGLKKQAKVPLELFIREFLTWSFREKQEFVIYFLKLIENNPVTNIFSIYSGVGTIMQIPYFLRCHIKDVLLHINPKTSFIYRSLGYYFDELNVHSFFEKALEIDPLDNKSRAILVSRILYRVDYQLHHLPEYFIGDVENAKVEISNAKNLIVQFSDTKLQKVWGDNLSSLEVILNNYIFYTSLNIEKSLEVWGIESGKRVGLGCATYYYEK